ncbi:MAG TPA: SDR family oxidoreductase [Catenuloplanes sp.]
MTGDSTVGGDSAVSGDSTATGDGAVGRFDLTGRRALVTGGGQGIGAAVAVALAEAGADVAVHYRQSARGAAEVVDRIHGLGRRAIALAGDLTVTEQADRVVGEAAARLGGLDVVVCNSGGLLGRCPVADMPDEHYEGVLAVNVGSTFRTCRAALPYLRGGDRAGRIITMSSLAAETGGSNGAVLYATAKAAIRGFTKGLAKEVAGDGITVNALAPGFIGETAFHTTFTPPAAQEKTIAGIPLGRPGVPADVAGVVVWLASDAAAFVTGTTIDIDGGVALR